MHLSIFALAVCALRIMHKKKIIAKINVKIFPMLSYSNFRASGLIFKYLIHFKTTFAYGVTKSSNFILLHVDNQFL
jgi:hypothetical protein